MSYKIGKLKVIPNGIIEVGQVVDPTIISVSDSLDTNKYDDITSIENWVLYGDILCTDKLQLRSRIKDKLNELTWSGLTNTEKEVVIDYYLKETSKSEDDANTEKVMYLLGVGYNMSQAQSRLIKSYADYHLWEISSCSKRANSEQLYVVIAKYLSLTDAGDLIKITHKLFDLYKTQGIRGINDGNAGEGLFDFLESTVGTPFETTGLLQQGYVLRIGTYTSFIDELMDVLRNGNY